MSQVIRAALVAVAAVSCPILSSNHVLAKEELVLAIGGEPKTGFDPLRGWGKYGHPLFQSTLLRRDAAFDTRPDLATDWTLSGDRLIWTIKLRPDVRFSDGTPLTARDVAYTFNEAARLDGTVDLSALDKATAIDDHTVEIRLKKPWITFADHFYTLGIVPAATYGEGYARSPVGSGPYKLVSWAEGEQLIVEQNPYYYGAGSPFRRLTFLFTGEDTSLAAARAGQVDVVAVPAVLADAVPSTFNRVVVESVDNRGLAFPMVRAEGRKSAAGAPIGNDVTADRAIRRAINLGVDRNQLVEVALLGYGKPAFGPADGLPWSNPDAAVTYDVDAALKLLDEAGWKPGADGIRVKDGVRAAFPINYPASDSTRQAIAVTVAEQLRPLGIEATAVGTNWDAIGRTKHAEPTVFGWGDHSPLEVYNLYQSGLAGVDLYNVGYFSNPAVDAHFQAAQSAPELGKSYPDWQKAEWDGETGFGPKGDAGWAWLVNLQHIYLVNECIDTGPQQIEPHGHGWPFTALIGEWKWTCG